MHFLLDSVCFSLSFLSFPISLNYSRPHSRSSLSSILIPSTRLCSYMLILYYFLSITHCMSVSLLLNVLIFTFFFLKRLIFTYVYLSCLKPSNSLSSSPSLYFFLFSLNLRLLSSPIFVYHLISLSICLSLLLYSLLILLTSHALSLFLSFFQFFFLCIIISNSPSLYSLPLFLPLLL